MSPYALTPRRAVPALFVVTVLFSNASIALAEANVLPTFMQHCLPHIDDREALRASAREAGLVELPPQLASGLLQGQPGVAFDVDVTGATAVSVVSPDTGGCRVFSARQDAATIDAQFRGFIERLQSAGWSVEPLGAGQLTGVDVDHAYRFVEREGRLPAFVAGVRTSGAAQAGGRSVVLVAMRSNEVGPARDGAPSAVTAGTTATTVAPRPISPAAVFDAICMKGGHVPGTAASRADELGFVVESQEVHQSMLGESAGTVLRPPFATVPNMAVILRPPASCALLLDATELDVEGLEKGFDTLVARLGANDGTVAGGPVPSDPGYRMRAYTLRPAQSGLPNLDYRLSIKPSDGGGSAMLSVSATKVVVEAPVPDRVSLSGRSDSILGFGGEQFVLAYEGRNEPVWTREYLPADQKLESWRRLLTVQVHKPSRVNAAGLARAIVPPNSAASGMPEPQIFQLPDGSAHLVASALPDPQRGIIEINVYKITDLEPGTVLMQIDARRIDNAMDAETLDKAIRAHWESSMDMFAKTSFQLVQGEPVR